MNIWHAGLIASICALTGCSGIKDGSSSRMPDNFGMAGGIDTPAARSMPAQSITGQYGKTTDGPRASIAWQANDAIAVAYRRDQIDDLKIPKHFGGGLDAQARLLPESDQHPAIAIGVRSIAGQDHDADQYLVASKYIGPFDVSLGSRTGRRRDMLHQGIFGNVRYDLSLDMPVGLIAEGGSKTREQLGVDWRPLPYLGFSIAGATDGSVTARLALRVDGLWSDPAPPHQSHILPVNAAPSNDSLYRLELLPNGNRPPGIDDLPQPAQREQTIITTQSGVTMGRVIIPGHKPHSPDPLSPEERWQEMQQLPANQPIENPPEQPDQMVYLRIRPVMDIDVYEATTYLLYRRSLIASADLAPGNGFRAGAALRLRVDDTLDHLRRNRRPTALPVRSDIRAYQDDRIDLENLYLGNFNHPLPNLYTYTYGGILEEMYAGFGSELLYSPP